MAAFDIFMTAGSPPSSFETGMRSMPQKGQAPGSDCLTCGCMEQVQSPSALSSEACSVSNSVPELPPKNIAPAATPSRRVKPTVIRVDLFNFILDFV